MLSDRANAIRRSRWRPVRTPWARRVPAPAAGTALVGTLVGFVMILVLLLFSAQLLVRLYATSVLASVATRAAETVAQSPVPVAAEGPAEQAARASLGSFAARRAVFRWREVDSRRVVLEIAARSPQFLPGLSAWDSIERTVTIRTERFR